MLGLINHYLHGFVSVPINLACKKKGLFELLEHHRELTLEQIVEFLGANGGHLQVALRMMQSINWLERNEIGQYYLTDEAELHKKIPEEILDLYHLPLYLYVKGDQQLGLFKDWIERSSQRWNVEEPMMEMGLDSLELLELRTLLSQRLEVELEPTFIFQYATKDAIARYFKSTSGKDVRIALPNLDEPENSCDHNSDSSEVINTLEDLIAIIGMSCQFPSGINNLAQYWSVLHDDINAIIEVPKHRDRWALKPKICSRRLQI